MINHGYDYIITRGRADSSFKYDVSVLLDGKVVGHTYSDTLWGGRRLARRIARRHQSLPRERVVEKGQL